MKSSIIIYTLIAFAFASTIHCSSVKEKEASKTPENTIPNDTVKIVNEEEEYEVIIIDPGFSVWLNGRAKARGYNSLAFLETKNYQYVTEWNIRTNNPQRFSPDLYTLSIDYQSNINYGYEVNYLLYNYFLYFQNTYNQRLIPGAYLPIN